MKNDLRLYARRREVSWTEGLPLFILTVAFILALFAAWKVSQAQDQALKSYTPLTQDEINERQFCATYLNSDCYGVGE